MKKTLVLTSILLIIAGLWNRPIFAIRNVNEFDEQPQLISNTSEKLIEEPKEELYKNLFITLEALVEPADCVRILF